MRFQCHSFLLYFVHRANSWDTLEPILSRSSTIRTLFRSLYLPLSTASALSQRISKLGYLGSPNFDYTLSQGITGTQRQTDIFFVWIDGKKSILIAKSLDHIQEKSMGMDVETRSLYFDGDGLCLEPRNQYIATVSPCLST